MIRLIVRTQDASMAANVGGDVHTRFTTFDVALPEVEVFIRGENEGRYTECEVVGAEILEGGA